MNTIYPAERYPYIDKGKYLWLGATMATMLSMPRHLGLELPHEENVEFCVYIPTHSKEKSFMREVNSLEYSFKKVDGKIDKKFLLIKTKMVYNEANITNVGLAVANLALKYGGEFIGVSTDLLLKLKDIVTSSSL